MGMFQFVDAFVLEVTMVNPALLLGAQRIRYLAPYLSMHGGMYEHQSWLPSTIWSVSWEDGAIHSEPDE